MICTECQQPQDDGNLFCRNCLAGLQVPAADGKHAIEQFESLRLICENFVRGLSSPEDFTSTLSGMKRILEMSIAVSGGLYEAPDLEERTGIKIRLIMEGLQSFLESVEMLVTTVHGGEIQKVVQGLAIAEAGAYKLDDGMKTIALQLSANAVQAHPFQNTWLDAAKKNIEAKKTETEL